MMSEPKYVDIWTLLKNYVRDFETVNNCKFSNEAWQRIKQLETDIKTTMQADLNYTINLQTDGKANTAYELSQFINQLEAEQKGEQP